MTYQEYQEYQKTVESFFIRERIQNLSQIDSNEESYFSWSSCECCGSSLGGDRYHCNGFRPTSSEEVPVEKLVNLLWSTVLLLWSIVFNRKSFDNCLRSVFRYQISLGDVFEYEVCQDCLYYAEYGMLDDLTILDLENEIDEISQEELNAAGNVYDRLTGE